jgi:hypothetical protein
LQVFNKKKHKKENGKFAKKKIVFLENLLSPIPSLFTVIYFNFAILVKLESTEQKQNIKGITQYYIFRLVCAQFKNANDKK